MAKKKEKAKEVEREVALGNGKIIFYTDGTAELITYLTAEEVEELIGAEEEEEGDDDEGDSDEDEDEGDDEGDGDDEEEGDEDEEVTPESLAEMDFEDMEDLCEDQELEVDPDDFDEDDEKDVEKLRKAIAKELGIKLPAADKKGKKKK